MVARLEAEMKGLEMAQGKAERLPHETAWIFGNLLQKTSGRIQAMVAIRQTRGAGLGAKARGESFKEFLWMGSRLDVLAADLPPNLPDGQTVVSKIRILVDDFLSRIHSGFGASWQLSPEEMEWFLECASRAKEQGRLLCHWVAPWRSLEDAEPKVGSRPPTATRPTGMPTGPKSDGNDSTLRVKPSIAKAL